jgi:hypothetical protein
MLKRLGNEPVVSKDLIVPFPPRNIRNELRVKLDHFLANNDFVRLYTSYDWERDTFKAGFPDILRLEVQLTTSDRKGGISIQDVRDVANWGRLRNPGRIEGRGTVLPSNTLHKETGGSTEALHLHPTLPVCSLEENITRGIGPTYLSKVVRFGLPQEYGAIDTRCVRVFGQGDPEAQRHAWLPLRARNDGYGWYISRAQSAWPSAYRTWIDILRYFSQKLPSNCPHPRDFVTVKLRSGNGWTCADAEMALFMYASQFTQQCKA